MFWEIFDSEYWRNDTIWLSHTLVELLTEKINERIVWVGEQSWTRNVNKAKQEKNCMFFSHSTTLDARVFPYFHCTTLYTFRRNCVNCVNYLQKIHAIRTWCCVTCLNYFTLFFFYVSSTSFFLFFLHKLCFPLRVYTRSTLWLFITL